MVQWLTEAHSGHANMLFLLGQQFGRRDDVDVTMVNDSSLAGHS